MPRLGIQTHPQGVDLIPPSVAQAALSDLTSTAPIPTTLNPPLLATTVAASALLHGCFPDF